VEKEWRELWASRAWWVMLLLTGPLVGAAFISAVGTYADLSGLHGNAAGVGEAFSPLVGIWGPTFSAYELVAVFLLPFVAIRLVSGDRQSGALTLELQQPLPAFLRVAIKAGVLFAGWLIASAGAVAAVALWAIYGGAVYSPEVAAVALGHLLNAGLTVSLAVAAAGVADHPATAAILTLGVTVGSWVVSFVAAVHGGAWERLAGFTPPVMVGQFQRGLVRLDLVLAALALVVAGLAVCAVWMRIGVAVRQRLVESMAVVGVCALAVFASTFVRASWDLSEGRTNSFSRADERLLGAIRAPLRMEVHLAPEDPRRFDLERQALSKLRRVMPALHVRYVSATATGLFEQTSDRYGEIQYELAGRTSTNRLTSAEAVLETIYGLAGVEPPRAVEADVFRGHPLAASPTGAAPFFYAVWPGLVLAAFFMTVRRRT